MKVFDLNGIRFEIRRDSIRKNCQLVSRSENVKPGRQHGAII